MAHNGRNGAEMVTHPRRVALLTAMGGSLFLGMAERCSALTPFDFTGHWSGYAGEQETLLEGDFTGVGGRKFKGTLQANTAEQCTVKGKRKTEQVVLVRFNCHRQCDQGLGLRRSSVRLHGQLDVENETISGSYTSGANGCDKRKTSTGQFVLAKRNLPDLGSTPTTTSSTVPSVPTTTTAPPTTNTRPPTTSTTSTTTTSTSPAPTITSTTTTTSTTEASTTTTTSTTTATSTTTTQPATTTTSTTSTTTTSTTQAPTTTS